MDEELPATNTSTNPTSSSYDAVLHANAHNPTDRVQKSATFNSPFPSSLNGTGGNSSNHPSGLNPRSCVTCRRRKVKCDKKHPCTNCTKGHIDCIYPAPGRAPRKLRKPQDGELMERLRKLEGVVQSLGVSMGDEDGSQDEERDDPTEGTPKETEEVQLRRKIAEVRLLERKKAEKLGQDESAVGIESRFGRLVVDEGRSRYINPSFWASLSDEVEDIKGILNEDSDEEGAYPSPDSSENISNMQGYIFGHNSKTVDMIALHPPSEHVPIYWEIFKDRVDPLVKVLHIPTIEPTILEARHRLDQIHRSLEPLIFALYYSAITAMNSEDVRNKFGEDRHDLIVRYRFAVEQALARADFLQTDEMIVVQAYVIFLIALRRNDDARTIWSLTGLVVRMAQTLGLHRDPGHFDLPPFDTEMRRRLWWQITILDSRAAEDHGCDPSITEATFDTQMPLNVNDEDLSPNMTTFPDQSLGCTEMTFGLIRFEIVAILRRIQYVPPGPKQCNRFFATVTLEQKEQWISESHAKIEERYLKHCDMSVPLYWVIATVARLIMSKMWLMVYHPFQRMDGGNSLSQETKDKLFLTSLENIEYSLLLENEERTKKWGWLFQTYVQWHAIAFLLNELCLRTKGEYVARAWRALEAVLSRRWGAEHASNKLKSHLWRPLRRLMSKARAARNEELEREKLAVEQANAAQGLSAADIQDPSIDIAPVTSFGLSFDLPSSGTSPRSGFDYLNIPIGLTPPPTGFTQSSDPQLQGNLTSATVDGFHMIQGADLTSVQSSNISLSPETRSMSSAPLQSSTGVQQQPGLGLDWLLADPNNQMSMGQDELLLDGSMDWANWDEMVAQFGAAEGAEDQDMMPGAGDGLLSAGMPGPKQAAALNPSATSGLRQWY